MKGGFCYKQYTITDAIFGADNKTITFMNCADLIKSTANLQYSANLTTAATISLMKNIDCRLVDFSITGNITVDGVGNINNHIYGLGVNLSRAIININISLAVVQKNDGMGSSSLIVYNG